MASLLRTFLIFSIVFLIFGIFKLPYGYYTFLRIFITLSAIGILISDVEDFEFSQNVKVGSIIVSLLYNPIMPVYLNKTAWLPINIFTVIYFMTALKISSEDDV